MIKMGYYKNLPVYRIMDMCEMDIEADNFYAFGEKLLYHGSVVGQLQGSQLLRFDEQKFDWLREIKRERKSVGELLGEATGVKEEEEVAETAPQSAEAPEYETVEASDRLVDDFMAHWRENIDNEIAMLKEAVSAMEVGNAAC